MCLSRHQRRRWSEIFEDRAFSGSNGRLQATWHGIPVRQRATSRSSVQLAFAFVVFRILSVTCSLTHALSQSLAHAQQLFSASTPGQILAPRVCTLVLFIFYWSRKPPLGFDRQPSISYLHDQDAKFCTASTCSIEYDYIPCCHQEVNEQLARI